MNINILPSSKKPLLNKRKYKNATNIFLNPIVLKSSLGVYHMLKMLFPDLAVGVEQDHLPQQLQDEGCRYCGIYSNGLWSDAGFTESYVRYKQLFIGCLITK